MPATVTQIGSTVRVEAKPRSITDVDIIDNELIISYSDATMESAGFIGDTLPNNALVGRPDGSLLKSRVTGEQLVGRSV